MPRVHPSLIETNTPSGKRHRRVYEAVEKAWRTAHPDADPTEADKIMLREVMTLVHEFERMTARAAAGNPPTGANMAQLTCELSRLRVALGIQAAPDFADLDGPIFRQFAGIDRLPGETDLERAVRYQEFARKFLGVEPPRAIEPEPEKERPEGRERIYSGAQIGPQGFVRR